MWVKVPSAPETAPLFGEANSNHAWPEAMDKEVDGLTKVGCFEFMPPNFKPGPDCQEIPLCMTFDVKQRGHLKGWLIANGHKVDPGTLSTRATVVKGISVCLLDIMAHHQGLKTLLGNISKTFINAT